MIGAGAGGVTRCSTCPSTVSFGPNACMRPSFSTSSWSTASMPIGRCATTTTMAPRSRAANRAGQRLVAFGIEIGVRLVEHDQEGMAVQRPRQPDALRLPGRQGRALLADLGVVTFTHLDDHLVHAGLLGRGDDRIRFGVGIEREMFWAIEPANSSTSCGK